jgi:hypothetical protein
VLPLVTLVDPAENQVMFTVHCPRHGRQVLLDDDRILGIDRDADGLRVRWICWCGHSGSHCTGRPSPAPTIV